MSRVGLDLSLFRILLIAVPFSCGPQTFHEPAPDTLCGSSRLIPYDASRALADGGTSPDGGNSVDGGSSNPIVGLSNSQCADLCGNTFSCNLEVSDGGRPSVRCYQACYGAGCGRRPEALPPLADGSPDAVASYFAQAAYLESASVHAFCRLARELAAHGAPAELVSAAGKAAADEVRHTRVMSRLARRYGGTPKPAPRGSMSVRPLIEIAQENAVEGCVRETYGALVAWIQAAAATDPAVQRALRPIAADETAHAELAFAVADWLASKLPKEARAAVAAAQLSTIHLLRREVACAPPRELLLTAGLPSSEVAARLIAEASRTIWA